MVRASGDGGPAEASEQYLIIINALSLLSFIEEQRDNLDEAEALAHRALEVAEENVLTYAQQSWSAYVALDKILTRRGELARAERMLERGVELQHLSEGFPELTGTLLALASVRGVRGVLEEARALIEEAREMIERCADPGILSSLLERTKRNLRQRALCRQPGLSEELSEREAAVLKLLSTDLTQRQIGGELYISLSTVKSHTRAIYRKLGVSSRAGAVEQARLSELLS